MKECQFCGAESFNSDTEGIHYKCGTCATVTSSTRQPKCYQTEIALLKEDLDLEKLAFQLYVEAHLKEIAGLKATIRKMGNTQAGIDSGPPGTFKESIK